MKPQKNQDIISKSQRISRMFFYFLLILVCGTVLIIVFKGNAVDNLPPEKAVLEIEGKVAAEFFLSDYKKTEEIDLTAYGLNGKIEINSTGVRFIEMDCPDKICVKTSWIKDKQSIAVCMPNKASLFLK